MALPCGTNLKWVALKLVRCPRSLAAYPCSFTFYVAHPIHSIVGVVDVVDCVKQHSSKWKFEGSCGWVLQNPRRLPFRECKGFVGLFRPEL